MKLNYGIALGLGFMLFGALVFLMPVYVMLVFVIGGFAILWKRDEINAQLSILDIMGVAPQIDVSEVTKMLSAAMPQESKEPKEPKKKREKRVKA